MQIIEKINHELPYLASEALDQTGGVAHGFSTRLGGVSEGMWASLNLSSGRGDDPDHVRENCRRFLAAIGAQGGKLVRSNQVHGNTVRVVTSADWNEDLCQKSDFEADALMTATPGVTLMIFTADCIPVLFYDPVRRVVAAAHAGWRGTADGVVTRTGERMEEVYGCNPADILAAIGPGICASCFETHEDVPNAMMASMGTSVLQHIQIKDNGKFSVNLKGINAQLLEMAGLREENISVCDECTACDTEKYWSHRKVGNNRGSMASAIQLL